MSKLGFMLTMEWCEDCLPEGLQGLDPMTTSEAQDGICEECGVELHGDDTGVEAPTPQREQRPS